MSGIGRFMYLSHLPITLLMLAWAWVGRLFFGLGGWLLFVMALISPIVVLAVIIAEVVTLSTPVRPRAFTRAQSVSHFMLWASLAGMGVFIVEFGDTPDSAVSVFTKFAGRGNATTEFSTYVSFACLIVLMLAWMACLVTGIMARRHAAPLDFPAPSYPPPYQPRVPYQPEASGQPGPLGQPEPPGQQGQWGQRGQ